MAVLSAEATCISETQCMVNTICGGKNEAEFEIFAATGDAGLVRCAAKGFAVKRADDERAAKSGGATGR